MLALPRILVGVAMVSALGLIGSTFDAIDAPRTAVRAAAVPTAPAVADALASNNSRTAFENDLLKRINKARSTKRKCGSKTYTKAKALKWNTKLATVAKRHSVDMATNDFFSHTNKKGKSPGARVKAIGYKYKAAGETLSAGRNSAKAVVDAWLKSPAHCKILMSKSYTQIGVAHHAGKGKYRYYTTANFAKPKK